MRSCDSRYSATSARVTVCLRDDDGSKIRSLLERLCLRLGLLTYRGVEHHDRLVRLDGLLDIHHLLEQGRLLSMSTGGIDDDDLEALLLKLVNTFAGDLGGVCLGQGTVVGDLGFGGILFQLIKGTGSERVGTNEAGSEASRLVMSGELGTCRRLTGTLQTDEHDDIGLALLGLERLGMGVNELDEFIEDGLLYEALLVDGGWEVLEVDGGADGVLEAADELDVDVGFEEGSRYLVEHGFESLHHATIHVSGRRTAGIVNMLGPGIYVMTYLLIEIGGSRGIV